MKPQKIKKGRKGINHFPHFLKYNDKYSTGVMIDSTWLYVDDSCRPGWSKLWGIAMGHIHWNNSYRFVFRIQEGEVKIGYYAYVGGVSPQKDKRLKGYFDGLKFDVGDQLELQISIEEDGVMMKIRNILKDDNWYGKKLPLPEGVIFPVTRCYPNIKCPATMDIIFDFYEDI